MSKYKIIAGLTNDRKNAENLKEKIKAIGYNPVVINPVYSVFGVSVIETENEQEARAARDKINKMLGVNAGLKIKD